MRRWRSLSTTAAVLPLFAACAEGGKEIRSTSEVKLSRTHHMVGFVGARSLADFPIKAASVASDRGTLIMGADGNYKIGRPGGTSAPSPYELAKTGKFSVIVPIGSRQPDARFSGGYGLDGDSGIYCFTDRHATSATSMVGLYFGLPVVTGTADLKGDWHLFSQHVIFSSSIVQSPENIARGLGGEITVDAAGKVTAGKGVESTKVAFTFTGEVKPFADGRIDIALNYKDPQATDSRTFVASAAGNLVLGLDEDETDGETGLLVLLRKLPAKGDLAKLAGTYWVGCHTIFVTPGRAGVDAAAGLLTLNDKGGFRLEATGAGDVDFVYTGTITLKDDGALEIKVDGTNETWAGAIDVEYRTILLLDNFVETRSGQKPAELNLFFGLREKKP
jgi:hypothetical protein